MKHIPNTYLLDGTEDADVLIGNPFRQNIIDGDGGSDVISGGNRRDILDGDNGEDVIFGGNGSDVIDGGNGADVIDGGNGRDIIDGGNGADIINGGNGRDIIDGGNGDDTILGGRGKDILAGGNGTDILTGGQGKDSFVFDGTVNDGLREDEITDFSTKKDTFVLDASDFGVSTDLEFVAADFNDQPDALADGADANVIVVLNGDDDGDAATAFNARSAATQIADSLGEQEAGPGFFVYFNSGLGINRLVHSEDLSDAGAALSIVARLTDVDGQDAIDNLANFSEDNFDLV